MRSPHPVSKLVSVPRAPADELDFWGYGWRRVGSVKFLRGFVQEPRTVDIVVAVLSTWLVLGAYVISYAYVYETGHILEPAYRAGFTFLTAAWALLTLYLFAGFALGLRAGRPWSGALPEGETGTFMAALVFGAAWIVDAAFWSPIVGSDKIGVESLFTPPHLVEIGAAAVIVSGPLRAAARRGEAVASPVALLSATLLLSVLSFGTQFVHPLIDPWGMTAYEFRSKALPWIGDNIGVAELLAQTAILAGTALLLNSAFKLRLGALTFVFGLNGVFVCITKLHFELLAVPIVAGVAADAFVAWSASRSGKPAASLCAVIGGAYAFAYMVDVSLHPGGSEWDASLWIGSIMACTMLCWLLGRVLRAGLPAALVEPYMVMQTPEAVPAKWTLDPGNAEEREQMVHRALEDLRALEALGRSPLMGLPGITSANELRALLEDMITELATSTRAPREAESGRVLLDYYVKRVGSHEVVQQRLHLSHAVYYRRLGKGFELIAARLDDVRVPPRVPVT
jgi:hypothetical protein